MNLLSSYQKRSGFFYSKWRKLWKAEIITWAKFPFEMIFSKHFQNKIRKFGFYRCHVCDNKWMSAKTWLIPGKGLLKQKCKNGCKNLNAFHTVSQQTTSKRKFQMQQMENFKWPCPLLGYWYGTRWSYAAYKRTLYTVYGCCVDFQTTDVWLVSSPC